jgi:hypothetical protein
VASRLAGEKELLEEEPVGAVLGFGEAGRRYEVVDRHCLVADVLTRFTDATRKGRRVEAVLVTPTGDEAEHAIGIITIQDLPRLYDLLSP